MVDAIAAIRSSGQQGDHPSASGDAHGFTIGRPDARQLSAYAALAGSGIAAPAQTPEWIRSWAKGIASDIILATIHRSGEPIWSLALEVRRSGPVRVASFLGGRHANGNFPALSRNSPGLVPRDRIAELFSEIKRLRPDIDLLQLERLADELDGIHNPLLQFPHHPSPNVALAVDLQGGFDAMLERTSAKRKRKKHRSQTRKFEAAGGFRRITGETPQDVERLLGAFFAMKEQRLAKMGVANVFGDPAIRRFFTDLFTSSLGASPPFVLHGLEVGGMLRAVTGSSVCGSRMVCEFGAIAEDELAYASPGDFLFFENIRQAAEAGFALYDFSIGDEPYKRLWCDREITQYDVLVPLSLKGRIWAAALRAVTSAKTAVKNNRTLWSAVKRLRSRAVGKSAPQADPEN